MSRNLPAVQVLIDAMMSYEIGSYQYLDSWFLEVRTDERREKNEADCGSLSSSSHVELSH